MQIKSIKFYALIPSTDGKQGGTRVAPTFFQVGADAGDHTIQALSYEVDHRFLKVHQETDGGPAKTYIYNIEDISGRIEITH